MEKLANFPNSSVQQTHNSELLYVDCSETYPGFYRLSLFSPNACRKRCDSEQFDPNRYQKAFKVPDHLPSLLKLGDDDTIHCMGVFYSTFPFHRQWEGGRNRLNFPSQFLLSSVISIRMYFNSKITPKKRMPRN